MTNYYGTEYSHPDVVYVSTKFKNCSFPNFNKSDFEVIIKDTEISLFDSETVNMNFDLIKSCEKHIFSPPYIPCDDCILMNKKLK